MMKNQLPKPRKQELIQCSKKHWVSPLIYKLHVKNTFNDPPTCDSQFKFAGTDETLAPSGTQINCGPSLS
jgi:hypothetical protein